MTHPGVFHRFCHRLYFSSYNCGLAFTFVVQHLGT